MDTNQSSYVTSLGAFLFASSAVVNATERLRGYSRFFPHPITLCARVYCARLFIPLRAPLSTGNGGEQDFFEKVLICVLPIP